VINGMKHFSPATQIVAGDSRNLRKINNEIGAAISTIEDRVRGVANSRAELHDAIVVQNGFPSQLLERQHMVERLETKARGAHTRCRSVEGTGVALLGVAAPRLPLREDLLPFQLMWR